MEGKKGGQRLTGALALFLRLEFFASGATMAQGVIPVEAQHRRSSVHPGHHLCVSGNILCTRL